MKKIQLFGLLLMAAVSFTGCHKTVEPKVSTVSVYDITPFGCYAKGVVLNDGGADVAECGFCWDTHGEPGVTGDFVACASGLGYYFCKITGLEEGTTYYLRAYAVNEAGIGYGEVVSFTTKVIDDD